MEGADAFIQCLPDTAGADNAERGRGTDIGLGFSVDAGQCVVLAGPSRVGKSSILKLIYGNYRCDSGQILVPDGDVVVDLAAAPPRRILSLRRRALGYVSQFLRAVPRVSALDVVAEPLVAKGIARETALARAGDILGRFNVPERLWSLPPATFSGGEQQRINLARGLLPDQSVFLLDEPIALLDAANRQAVIVAVVHDDEVCEAIADVSVEITRFAIAA